MLKLSFVLLLVCAVHSAVNSAINTKTSSQITNKPRVNTKKFGQGKKQVLQSTSSSLRANLTKKPSKINSGNSVKITKPIPNSVKPIVKNQSTVKSSPIFTNSDNFQTTGIVSNFGVSLEQPKTEVISTSIQPPLTALQTSSNIQSITKNNNNGLDLIPLSNIDYSNRTPPPKVTKLVIQEPPKPTVIFNPQLNPEYFTNFLINPTASRSVKNSQFSSFNYPVQRNTFSQFSNSVSTQKAASQNLNLSSVDNNFQTPQPSIFTESSQPNQSFNNWSQSSQPSTNQIFSDRSSTYNFPTQSDSGQGLGFPQTNFSSIFTSNRYQSPAVQQPPVYYPTTQPPARSYTSTFSPQTSRNYSFYQSSQPYLANSDRVVTCQAYDRTAFCQTTYSSVCATYLNLTTEAKRDGCSACLDRNVVYYRNGHCRQTRPTKEVSICPKVLYCSNSNLKVCIHYRNGTREDFLGYCNACATKEAFAYFYGTCDS